MGEKEISDIKGIGPKLAERIQKTHDIESIEHLVELTEEQLTEVKGIGSSKAKKILSSLEKITKECERCGEKFVDEDTCPECTIELQEKLDPIKKEIEYFKNDNFSGKRWEIEKTLEKIDSELSKGKFEESERLIELVEKELAEAQDFSEDISNIEKILEEKRVINLPTYREELQLAREYMRYGDYEEANNRAEKILDYLEKEKRYEDVGISDLSKENIEEFSKYIMGVGQRAGEKIYSSGFHTLEDIYKAGPEKLQEKADIEEGTAKRLLHVLDYLFEDVEIERHHEEKISPQKEGNQAEEIFRDAREEETELKEEKKEKESEPVKETEEKEETKRLEKTKKANEEKKVKKKQKKKERSTSPDELLSMKENQIQKNERELKHWIPAIIIPVILAIVAYVLFLM